MADKTKIEWTEATWNPITGCTVHSAGCTNCYAMKLAGTRMKHHWSREGLTKQTKAGPVWNGEVRFNEQWLDQPLRWAKPRMIFVCAHADLFHESVPDEWIDKIFAVMALCPQHTFQVLTKRSGRMLDYLNSRKGDAPLKVALGDGTLTEHPWNNQLQPPKNVWLGVSVENQAAADERIPDLLNTPAAVRWLSCEPLLGPVNLTKIDPKIYDAAADALTGRWKWTDGPVKHEWEHVIDWVVVGGESGPGARPMHQDWARFLRDQCTAAGTPFFFKQWGDWLPLANDNAGHWPTDTDGCIRLTPDGGRRTDGWPMQRVGKKFAGRMLDGVQYDGMPA